MELREAMSDRDYKTGAELFKEYEAQIGVDLEFQNFSRELKNIRNQYSRPEGILFIAYDTGQKAIGCFAIRKLDTDTCELKRMYLRREARGKGLGKQFLEKSVQMGKELGYEKMRLDTLPEMQAAIGLYKKTGFYEIEPYRFNPVAGAIYMEIKLE